MDGIGYLIDSGAEARLNALIGNLEQETGAEIAVVTLSSIGEESPKDFAVRLFNYWQIGKKGKENGILVLHIADQRRVEIEIGYGNEGAIPDIIAKRILETHVIPNFKEGRFSLGLVLGVHSLIRCLKMPNLSLEKKLILPKMEEQFNDNSMEYYLSQSDRLVTLKPVPGIFERHLSSPFQSAKEYATYWYALGSSLLFLFIGSILAVLPIGKFAFYQSYLHIGRWIVWLATIFAVGFISYSEYYESESFWSILQILPFGFLLLKANGWILKRLRENPRSCGRCGNRMIKLNEKEDNAYLDAGEITEEKIKSLDYDIWYCKNCQHTQKEKYSGESPASGCPRCSYKTFREVSRTVISVATESHGGEEIVNSNCAHCKHQSSVRIYTTKLSPPSSSGSGSSSWSSSGSSGSWGGGSSGGGGAGSSY
ncbi:hypothetical protein LPTSP4_14240 [Leptospira ryugenii]|uniref:TPM domain-containing protein n=1 Tax=Leptospira ryugenii TaxID=1917863 RepID=A0A2P2DZ45_9LEPT|nr:hypothetical protein LPTSP4_14240 [Leptospira ryugenii]